ncbi:unnamed protein product [Rotaria sp. Silwood2]|nr:unnamed protein product [Rotaria sp. Silwood2]CAF2692686.1 unnamed protein product [Rotaria sp. Silwood2]CAF4099945.1 unnamed protein product [Rotaria sp. Silwood2]
MNGQHILVTGAVGGIGFAIARLFLAQGANVSLHYHRNVENLGSLLNEYSNQCHALSVNATDEQAVQKGVEESCNHFGLINVCIINHAVVTENDIPIWDMSLDQWQHTMNVDLTSYFLYAREWCRQLKHLKSWHDTNINACLLFIGSSAGKFGEANHIDYATAKGGLHSGFIKSLKNEIIHIIPQARCNIVAPGWTRTPMVEKSFEEGKHVRTLQMTPLRKVATTDDVAKACLFLASHKTAGHISGEVLMVHGGMEGRVLWQ